MGADVDDDVRRQLSAFYAAKAANPDLIPYIGPEDTLRRYLCGEVIKHTDMVTDQSPFIIQAVLPAQMRRLEYMVSRDDESAPSPK